MQDHNLDVYILSIHHGSADALYKGIKPHEFRKRFENYFNPIKVYLYETIPIGKITGYIIFDKPIIDNPENLINLLEKNKYDTKDKLNNYFLGVNKAFALPVLKIIKFNKEISLEELKSANVGFLPPMSYIKLNKNIKLNDYLKKKEI